MYSTDCYSFECLYIELYVSSIQVNGPSMKRMVKAHARGLIGARNRRDFATSDDDPTTDDRGERMTAEDDLLVAAKYAELETRALASVVSSRETAGEAKLNTGVPEFTFDDDDDDDGDGDGDESSEWSDSDDDQDEALDDDDDASTSCESIDAKDLPEWLRRARWRRCRRSRRTRRFARWDA